MLALELRKNGQDLADYAEIIRTRAYHKRCGIDEPTSQKIATEVVETCFKLHILVEQFVKSVEAFNEFSKKYAKDNPKQAIEYANTLISYIDNLHEVIRKLRQKEVDIKTRCDNAGMNFQYLAKYPGIKNVLLDKDRQIDDMRHQRDEFKKERDALKEELKAKPNKQSEVKVIHPNQKIIELFPLGLEELNKKLAIPVTSEDIFFKLEQIALRPHAYSELFIRELAVKEDLKLELNSDPPERSTEDRKSVLK